MYVVGGLIITFIFIRFFFTIKNHAFPFLILDGGDLTQQPLYFIFNFGYLLSHQSLKRKKKNNLRSILRNDSKLNMKLIFIILLIPLLIFRFSVYLS